MQSNMNYYGEKSVCHILYKWWVFIFW